MTQQQVTGLFALVALAIYALGMRIRDRVPDSIRRRVEYLHIGLIAAVIFVLAPTPLLFATKLFDPWAYVVWPGFVAAAYFASPFPPILAVASFVGLTKLIVVIGKSSGRTFAVAAALGPLFATSNVVVVSRWIWPSEPITAPTTAYIVAGGVIGGSAAGIFIASRVLRLRRANLARAPRPNSA